VTKSIVFKILCVCSFLFMATEDAATGAERKYCLPTESCWPKAEEWEALNKEVNGKLISVKSFLDPCKTDVESLACKTALKDAESPFFLESRPDATQSSGYFNAWISTPSQYAIAAEKPEDIVAGVNFAKKHNIKIVIKGTGHDYLGRSNAPDSLLIWTHKMREIQMHDEFVAQGCPTKARGIPAVTVGAGARWLEVYNEVTNKHGRYVQGGGCTSVGAVGGFSLGGGFGSFSKKFGTGASNMLEAEVVTADGKILIANACQNQDLFWALRGGGGGTFGIVSKMTYKTHQLPKNFGIVSGKVLASSNEAYKALLQHFLLFFRDNLHNEHWGEQFHVRPDNSLELFLLFQGLSEQQVKDIWEPFKAWVASKSEYTIEFKITNIPPQRMWDYEYIKERQEKDKDYALKATKEEGSPYWWLAGNQEEVSEFWVAYKSRWIPAKMFENEHINDLANVLFKASRQWEDIGFYMNKGLAGGSPEALKQVQETSQNPKVSEASLLMIVSGGRSFAFPGIKGYEPPTTKCAEEVAQKAEAIMKDIREATPGAGSYVNEADYFEPDWQNSFWGVNYPRLLSIKQKYDPHNIFTCHHCVGSENIKK